MEIYRVEHLLTGAGPYTSNDRSIDDALDKDFSSEHPAPCDDGIWDSMMEGFDYPHYRYAFESIEQLTDWFNDDAMQLLFENGYVVALYDVPAGYVRLGYCHLAYNHDVATVVEYFDTVPEW